MYNTMFASHGLNKIVGSSQVLDVADTTMASQHALGALGWSALQRDAEEEVGSAVGKM